MPRPLKGFEVPLAKPLRLPNVTRMMDQSLRDLCGRANQRIVEHGDDSTERHDAAATYHNAYMVWHRAQAELAARAGNRGDEMGCEGWHRRMASQHECEAERFQQLTGSRRARVSA